LLTPPPGGLTLIGKLPKGVGGGEEPPKNIKAPMSQKVAQLGQTIFGKLSILQMVYFVSIFTFL